MDITRAEPVVKSTNGPCVLWKLETTLSFPFLETDDGDTFICIVYDHTTEFMRENFTIGMVAKNPNSSANLARETTLLILAAMVSLVVCLIN